MLGLAPIPKRVPQGVSNVDQSTSTLEKEISTRITPPLTCTIDGHDFKGKKIIRVLVPRGDDPPYALDDNKIYVRDESETGLAVRDEIVGLVLRGKQEMLNKASAPQAPEASKVEHDPAPRVPATNLSAGEEKSTDQMPRTGVEVIPDLNREGGRYFTMRDLRNGNVVKNVTRSSARRLWHYAISKYDEVASKINQQDIQWQGDYGLLNLHKQGKTMLYDLPAKNPKWVPVFLWGDQRWYSWSLESLGW